MMYGSGLGQMFAAKKQTPFRLEGSAIIVVYNDWHTPKYLGNIKVWCFGIDLVLEQPFQC